MNKKAVADEMRREIQQFLTAWDIQRDILQEKVQKQPLASVKNSFAEKSNDLRHHIDRVEKAIRNIEESTDETVDDAISKAKTLSRLMYQVYKSINKEFE